MANNRSSKCCKSQIEYWAGVRHPHRRTQFFPQYQHWIKFYLPLKVALGLACAQERQRHINFKQIAWTQAGCRWTPGGTNRGLPVGVPLFTIEKLTENTGCPGDTRPPRAFPEILCVFSYVPYHQKLLQQQHQRRPSSRAFGEELGTKSPILQKRPQRGSSQNLVPDSFPGSSRTWPPLVWYVGTTPNIIYCCVLFGLKCHCSSWDWSRHMAKPDGKTW